MDFIISAAVVFVAVILVVMIASPSRSVFEEKGRWLEDRIRYFVNTYRLTLIAKIRSHAQAKNTKLTSEDQLVGFEVNAPEGDYLLYAGRRVFYVKYWLNLPWEDNVQKFTIFIDYRCGLVSQQIRIKSQKDSPPSKELASILHGQLEGKGHRLAAPKAVYFPG